MRLRIVKAEEEKEEEEAREARNTAPNAKQWSLRRCAAATRGYEERATIEHVSMSFDAWRLRVVCEPIYTNRIIRCSVARLIKSLMVNVIAGRRLLWRTPPATPFQLPQTANIKFGPSLVGGVIKTLEPVAIRIDCYGLASNTHNSP